MEPFLTLFWIAVAFGIWYLATQWRGPGAKGGSSGRAGKVPPGLGVRMSGTRRERANRDTRKDARGASRSRERLRTVEGSRTASSRSGLASGDLKTIDDPVTALATLALVLTGEDRTPTSDVTRTLHDRLSTLTDEVHVARALRVADKAARRADNPHAVIKQLAPVFERTLTPRERADVVAVCEDVISANGIISDHQSVWLRSLRRSLGFEVKG